LLKLYVKVYGNVLGFVIVGSKLISICWI